MTSSRHVNRDERAEDHPGGLGLLSQAVDWDLAAKTGALLVGKGPTISRRNADQVVAELAAASVRAEAPVRELTGLAAGLPVPAAHVVDRPGWIRAAALSMAQLAGSGIVESSGEDGDEPGALAGKPAGVQAGAMLAFLGSAVLGQYDPFTDEGGSLLLVAPNVVAVERALGVCPSDFRLWVCLHEVTHRVQLTAVGWLADYVRDTVAVVSEGVDEPLVDVLSRLVEELRRRRGDRSANAGNGADPGGVIGLLRAAQAPAQREALDRLMVLGTLLEGHADHVMDSVGPDVVPTVKQIRTVFDARRKRPRNPIQRLLRALFGVDAKLTQYVRGKAFVDAVVDRVGMERFNTIWTDPETLPLTDEIDKPDAWVTRVLG